MYIVYKNWYSLMPVFLRSNLRLEYIASPIIKYLQYIDYMLKLVELEL